MFKGIGISSVIVYLFLQGVLLHGATNTEIQKQSQIPKSYKNTEITDARVRALSGSESKYHLKLELEYSGSDISRPFASEQKDFSDGRTKPTYIEGSFSFRYRTNKYATFGVGSGLKFDKPFNHAENLDVSNPYWNYNRSYRLWGWQQNTSFKHSWYTNDDDERMGKNYALALDQYFVRGISDSRFSMGTILSYEHNFFNRDWNPRVDHFVVDYSLSFMPFLQYRVNDKVGLRTSLGFLALHNRIQKDRWTFLDIDPFQSIGASYRFTPDLYVYPYITFNPTKFAWKQTQVSIKGIFSVF